MRFLKSMSMIREGTTICLRAFGPSKGDYRLLVPRRITSSELIPSRFGPNRLIWGNRKMDPVGIQQTRASPPPTLPYRRT